MKRANQLHQEAMQLADDAMRARRESNHDLANKLFEQAFEKERDAALCFANALDEEPTRSVLLRSAASLALNCGRHLEAERLIGAGLAGNPPDEMRDELRDLFQRATFERHLDLNGVTLSSSELQMSLAGNSVGEGIVPAAEYSPRLKAVENLVVRTGERQRDLSFREGGKPLKQIRDDFSPFVTLPRAASFAVTIRIGSNPRQKHLFDSSENIVTEIVECLELFTSEKMKELRQKINNEAYYLNFIHLMRQLAPDGKRIQTVGFTAIQFGNERRVALTGPPSRTWYVKPSSTRKRVRLDGVLTAAAKGKKKSVIGIRDSNGSLHDVQVPVGMLNDIVRPLWDREVRIFGQQEGNRTTLEDIEPLENDEPANQAEPELVESLPV